MDLSESRSREMLACEIRLALCQGNRDDDDRERGICSSTNRQRELESQSLDIARAPVLVVKLNLISI